MSKKEKQAQFEIVNDIKYKFEVCIEEDNIDVIFKKNNVNVINFEFKSKISNDVELAIATGELVANCYNKKQFAPYYCVCDGENAVLFKHNDKFFADHSYKIENITPSKIEPMVAKEILECVKLYTDYYAPLLIDELKAQMVALYDGNNIKPCIERNNVITVFERWKNDIEFTEKIPDEELVNIFFTDILNKTKYKYEVLDQMFEVEKQTGFELVADYDKICFVKGNKVYAVKNKGDYTLFWTQYKRPPIKLEFAFIYDMREKLFTDNYRRSIGAQYTPPHLVKLQMEILDKHLGENWQDKYLVFDTCSGSGNLQKFISKDICYLSTLSEQDVLRIKSKGFENVVQFDFLTNKNSFPKFNYLGEQLDVKEIAKRENKQIIVLINPPYEKDMDLAFITKLGQLNSKMLVYYHDGVKNKLDKFPPCTVIDNRYFRASEFEGLKPNWGIFMSLLDFENPLPVTKLEGELFNVKGKENFYFDNTPSYKKVAETAIKEVQKGREIGSMYYNGISYITNKTTNKTKITPENLEQVMIYSGVLCNSHLEFYDEIIRPPAFGMSKEQKADFIIMASCYKNNKTIGTDNKTMDLFHDSYLCRLIKEYKNDLSLQASAFLDSWQNIYTWYENLFSSTTLHIGHSTLKDNILGLQEIEKTGTSRTGAASRRGECCTWNAKTLAKKYNTDIFTVQDNAQIALAKKCQTNMIELGMIHEYMSCWR
jgi:hypothetical protein